MMFSSITKNVLALRQNWPSFRTPFYEPEVDRVSNIPPEYNCRRILGSHVTKEAIDEWFIDSGSNDHKCMINIAETYGFSGGRVLEWGVGCSRMSRHLNQALRPGFIGVDVDSVNIQWCRENMKWGNYITVDKDGQIPLEDKSVDLIYGWSVMTHLSEEDQNKWLIELHRVCRGLVILSTHGFCHSAANACWWSDVVCLLGWVRRGFRDAGVQNADISDVVGDGYYRDVAHTPAYIYEHWTKVIDVLDVIPSAFGGSHDAVVCRAR
jgi:hypothetical protein